MRHTTNSLTWKKQLIDSQFLLSEQHKQILIGHPAYDQLGIYTLNVNNLTLHFDQSKLLPQFCEVNSVETQQGPITDVSDLMKQYQGQFDIIGNFAGEYHIATDPNVRPVQHPMSKHQ